MNINELYTKVYIYNPAIYAYIYLHGIYYNIDNSLLLPLSVGDSGVSRPMRDHSLSCRKGTVNR